MRIRLTRLFIIVLALCIPVWIIRGCVIAQNAAQENVHPPEEGITLKVYLHKTGEVVEMELEEYVLCVVSAEMPASYEPQALMAQAVAARTYTVRKLSSPCGQGGADVCTDSGHCQAFCDEAGRREKWGDNYEANEAKLENAVYFTAGEIITYDGEAIEAVFHSTSGGMTEDSEHVFSAARPYLRSVVSLGEEDAPRYTGEVSVSRSKFASAINKDYPDAKLKAATLEKNVEVVSRYESGRVETFKAGGATLSGKQMRALFSLNSANFSLSFTKDEVIISTIGFGHGVGMSQTGANSMAKNGSDYKEILTHYYSGVQIESLY